MKRMRESSEQLTVRRESRTGRIIRGAGVLAVAGLAVLGADQLGFKFPGLGLFNGGKSDPAPHGEVIYKGQTAKTASSRFLIEIGKGDAVIDVKAKQNWDKPGGIFSADFQSTNGTASVSDARDRSRPATLHVQTRYCANGLIEKTVKPDAKTGQTTTSVVFNMGKLSVCDATLLHTVSNDSSFHQDDTPALFQGKFDSFVAHAAETQAKAAPCPSDELAQYTSTNYQDYARRILAADLQVPIEAVTVLPGTVGITDPETQAMLDKSLKSFANKKDPAHPSQKFPALDMQYLSASGRAVSDSCYTNYGAVSLSNLEQFNPAATLAHAIDQQGS